MINSRIVVALWLIESLAHGAQKETRKIKLRNEPDAEFTGAAAYSMDETRHGDYARIYTRHIHLPPETVIRFRIGSSGYFSEKTYTPDSPNSAANTGAHDIGWCFQRVKHLGTDDERMSTEDRD